MPYATEENLTDLALKQWEACRSSRLRQIMKSLVKHLHGFVREVDLKEDEWLTAVNWLVQTGKISTEKRNEFILLSDVLGISMLVDAVNHRLSFENHARRRFVGRSISRVRRKCPWAPIWRRDLPENFAF